MKNAFVYTSLFLTVGYPSALAAEALGILPASLVSFPVFIGSFVTSGVLAIAFRDYSRPSSYDAPRDRKPVAQTAAPAPSTPARNTAWVHDTISA